MEKSTHKAEAVEVRELLPHPNADSLSIVRPFGSAGYEVVVKTADWSPGDIAVYVVPDSMVPLDSPEFSWLRERPERKYTIDGQQYHRVKVARLRKAYSMGLLVKAPEGVLPGEDCASLLGIKRYDPPVREQAERHKNPAASQAETKPTVNPPVYDIDSIRRYADIMRPGEPVVITEKIHGANCRFTAEDRGLLSLSWRNWSLALRVGARVLSWGRGRGFKVTGMPSYARWMRVGSRTQWRKPDPNDTWWRALASCPQVAEFCRNHPGYTLYGEVYGDVQDLDYGCKAGEVRFAAFDILAEDKRFVDDTTFRALCNRYGIPTVPYLAVAVGFDMATVLAAAEGPSFLAKKGGAAHVREGVVVKPLSERWDPSIGRVILKAVGNGYLERA